MRRNCRGNYRYWKLSDLRQLSGMTALDGAVYFQCSPGNIRDIARRYSVELKPHGKRSITPEMCAQLKRRGYNNKIIADMLGITSETVGKRLKRVAA